MDLLFWMWIFPVWTLFHTAGGLQCQMCQWMETGSEELDVFLMANEADATPACRDDPGSVEIPSVTCQMNDSCVESVIDTTVSTYEFIVDVRVFIRNCSQEPVSPSDLGCQDVKKYEKELREELGNAETDMLGELTGYLCHCNYTGCNSSPSQYIAAGSAWRIHHSHWLTYFLLFSFVVLARPGRDW